MLNIVIPMAGHGSRFAEAGYSEPKPLIPVAGRPMIQLVVTNLTPAIPHRFIFICQQAHLAHYPLASILQDSAPGCVIIPIDHVTEGAACTVLLARPYIDNASPLMIANCDQYVDTDINQYLHHLDAQRLDGLIMTMAACHPKWSYLRFDKNGSIVEVVEKQVVSNEATVGIYNYRQGYLFVKAALAMIEANERVNNEFYVAPAYNRMLCSGKKLGFYNVGSEGNGMYGLGVPEDLDLFKKHINQ